MKRIKMTYQMKKAISKSNTGYDPKQCRCIGEDEQAWLFETKDEVTGETVTFWAVKPQY